MANRSEHEHRKPEGSGTRGGGVPASRALVVLVAFVLITVLALSQIHTGPSKVASSSGSASTTTPTTSPGSGSHHRTTTSTTTIPPSAVQVVVFNASEVNGVARTVSNQLHPAGWNMLTPSNASETVTASRVYYLPGYRAPAVAIATSLQIPLTAVIPYSSSAPISSMGTAQVAVVVGPDLAARVSASKTSTTTTAASSTTGSSTTTSSTAG